MGYMKTAFENWIRSIPGINGTSYSKETISGYISSLRTHSAKLSDVKLQETDLFNIDNKEEFDRVYEVIRGSADFERINKSYHRVFSSALLMYQKFLKSYTLTEDVDMTQAFEVWIREYKEHKYTEGTIKRYIRALHKADEWLEVSLPKPIFTISYIDEFRRIQSWIKEIPNYEIINQSHGNGDLSAALSAYEKFLQDTNTTKDVWWPSIEEYDPELSKNHWLEMLNDGKTFTSNAYVAIACLYDFGGTASCRQLELKYGKTSDFYRATLGTQLASKVREKLKLSYCTVDGGDKKVWPILFQGRKATDEEAGSYVWRIRPELYDALTEFGIERFLSLEEGEEKLPQLSVKDSIAYIKKYIESKGFTYEENLIKNFYLSLKSKPFVILAGTSGTGKTKLVKLFAEAIGAEYIPVSVRPDWSDGSDLFGHKDIYGNPIAGPVCSAFEAALDQPDKPVFLCLDEMNLARVEYYLSDFLSVIELREKKDGHIVTSPIAQYKEGIPDNLYVIGTVNMDETTFPFSKKVLDRANTIEFSYVNLMNFMPKETDESVTPQNLSNVFLRTEYLVLAKDCMDEKDFVEKICTELQALNEKLVKANAHVGYRVRDEIVFYMMNNKKAGELLTYNQAMDNEIMQKILPRIQGSSAAIKKLLIDLFKFCMDSGTGIDTENGNVGEQMKNVAGSAKYPESAKKIGYMMTRFEDDGFTSYWL